jgi:hypothetical protein
MTLIKLILICGFLVLSLWAFRYRARVGIRAGVRLSLVAIVAAAIICVADPDVTQVLANAVGVTRGTDLVLYVLVVVFAFTAAGTYFRFRDIELRLARAVRAQAIRDALAADGQPTGSANR